MFQKVYKIVPNVTTFKLCNFIRESESGKELNYTGYC